MAPIIKKDHVELMTAGQAPAVRRRGHAKVATLLEIEGDVRAIEVQCTCGEKHVIELEYDQLAKAANVEQPSQNQVSPTEIESPTEAGPEEEMPS
ncbi:MAG: hypothetical protein ACI8TQ_000589 [Planctomycetota bacterium]|jgi:hypothetical protein